MSRRKHDASDSKRLQLVCTAAQRKLIEEQAARARTDVSTWVLAHCVRPAGMDGHPGSPLILGGQVADRLRDLAERQGINTDRALEQLLIAEG